MESEHPRRENNTKVNLLGKKIIWKHCLIKFLDQEIKKSFGNLCQFYVFP